MSNLEVYCVWSPNKIILRLRRTSRRVGWKLGSHIVRFSFRSGRRFEYLHNVIVILQIIIIFIALKKVTFEVAEVSVSGPVHIKPDEEKFRQRP